MEVDKITCENGVYHWRCKADEDLNRFECSRSVRMGLGTGIFMLLAGFLLLRGEMLLIMILACALTVLITLACGLYVLNTKTREFLPYTLTENDIRLREGRNMTFVSFKRVRYVESRSDRLILYTRFSKIPVYLPQEDPELIRALIEQRVLEKSRSF